METTLTAAETSEIRSLLAQVTAILDHAGTTEPALDVSTVARVEKLGPVAHRHLVHIEAHGSMTLGDSLAIRRELYGDNVRSTANLFGTKGSGALFYRPLPYGTPSKDSDPVDLTEEGRRIAAAYRALHPTAAV